MTTSAEIPITTIEVTLIGPTRQVRLTVDHAASAYGQPVLVDGDEVYGPSDIVPVDGIARYTARELVADAVRRETAMPELGTGPHGWVRPSTSDAIALAELFIGRE